MNCFTWSKEDNYLIVQEDHYIEALKNWQRPIHNSQLCYHTIKKKIKTEDTCNKYEGSDKFNVIPREGNPEIPIDYFFSLPDPRNKDKEWGFIIGEERG